MKVTKLTALTACWALLVLAFPVHSQVRQTTLFIDDGGGLFTALKSATLSAGGQTVNFGNAGGGATVYATLASGTGWTVGDLFMASSTTGVLTRVAIGSAGQLLSVNGGANGYTWTTASGLDMSATYPWTGAHTWSPTTDITAVTVKQTTAGSPNSDIFDVTNSGGGTTYLGVDKNGRVNIAAGLDVTGGTVTFQSNAVSQSAVNGLTSDLAAKLTNPLTTLGDIMYEDVTPAPAHLAGNTTAIKNFLTQTGTGAVSAVPAWGTLAPGDIPSLSASKITSGQISVAQGGTGIGSYTVGDLLYASGSTTLSKLGIGSAGQTLAVNGTADGFVWSSAGSGTVTSVAAGTGLSGGTITTTGTVSLNLGASDTWTGAEVFAPTTDITGLTVKQTSAGAPNSDIFDVTNSGGGTTYLGVDKNGNVLLPSLSASLPVKTNASKQLITQAIDLSLSTEVSNILGSANGGTGNEFTKFTGPTTSEKAFTLPNSSATLAYLSGGQTFTGGLVINGGLTLGTQLSEVYGGTNQTTYATGDILYASGSNTLGKRAIGTTGQVLTVSGGVPTWSSSATSSFLKLAINPVATKAMPTTYLDVNGDVAFRSVPITLANGANNDVDATNTSNLRIMGPSAAFSITGFKGGTPGKRLRIYNATAQALTLANQNASSVDTERLITLAGGDITLSSNSADGSAAEFTYDTTSQRWVMGSSYQKTVSGIVAPGFISVVRSSDRSAVSGTTSGLITSGSGGTADDVLTFNVGPSQTWQIVGSLIYQADQGAGSVVDIAFDIPGTSPTMHIPIEGWLVGGGASLKPSGVYVLGATGDGTSVASCLNNGSSTFGVSGSGSASWVSNFHGFFTTGTGSSGAVQILYAIKGTGNTITPKAGSYIVAQRVN